MGIKIDFSGYLLEGSNKESFHLTVTEPERSDSDDYLCEIKCPSLFKKEKIIYGVDADQALELSLEFVAKMMGGRKIIDEGGDDIHLSDLF